MNMSYWVFDCLFLHRLDCAVDLNGKVMAMPPLEASGRLASGIRCVTQ